jgi:ribosomal protein L30E
MFTMLSLLVLEDCNLQNWPDIAKHNLEYDSVTIATITVAVMAGTTANITNICKTIFEIIFHLAHF